MEAYTFKLVWPVVLVEFVLFGQWFGLWFGIGSVPSGQLSEQRSGLWSVPSGRWSGQRSVVMSVRSRRSSGQSIFRLTNGDQSLFGLTKGGQNLFRLANTYFWVWSIYRPSVRDPIRSGQYLSWVADLILASVQSSQ